MFIIIYLLIFFIGAGVLFFVYRRKQIERLEDADFFQDETANDFMNIKDIINNQLITKDNYICSYLKIDPIDINLLSDKEKYLKSKQFAAQFSDLIHPFKLIGVSKSEDNSDEVKILTQELENVKDPIRRKLYRQTISASQVRAANLEVPIREYYIMLWMEDETEKDFIHRVIKFKEKLGNCGINATIISRQGITELISRVTTPQYSICEELNPELNYVFLKPFDSDEEFL